MPDKPRVDLDEVAVTPSTETVAEVAGRYGALVAELLEDKRQLADEIERLRAEMVESDTSWCEITVGLREALEEILRAGDGEVPLIIRPCVLRQIIAGIFGIARAALPSKPEEKLTATPKGELKC